MPHPPACCTSCVGYLWWRYVVRGTVWAATPALQWHVHFRRTHATLSRDFRRTHPCTLLPCRLIDRRPVPALPGRWQHVDPGHHQALGGLQPPGPVCPARRHRLRRPGQHHHADLCHCCVRAHSSAKWVGVVSLSSFETREAHTDTQAGTVMRSQQGGGGHLIRMRLCRVTASCVDAECPLLPRCLAGTTKGHSCRLVCHRSLATLGPPPQANLPHFVCPFSPLRGMSWGAMQSLSAARPVFLVSSKM